MDEIEQLKREALRSVDALQSKVKPKVEQLPEQPVVEQEYLPPAEIDDRLRCPKCNSDQLHAGKKGFGLFKAGAGGLLLGPVGLLGGLVGSKKIAITCLKCGHTWQAGRK